MLFNTPSLSFFMPFKHFYTWIKYKTLPPSFLFKNRLFVERDSKRTRIFNNIGLTFRNERWTNWDATHFDWKWIDLFILMSRYIGGFLFALFIWVFWKDFLIELPVFNNVALKLWLIHDFVNYYSLYAVWIFILMRSFIWDTFIVVLFSGSAKHYYPLARREEATRREANQMKRVVREITTDIPEFLNDPKMFIWTSLLLPLNKRISPLFIQDKPSTLPSDLMEVARLTYRLNYLLINSFVSKPLLDEGISNIPLHTSTIAPIFSVYKNKRFGLNQVNEETFKKIRSSLNSYHILFDDLFQLNDLHYSYSTDQLNSLFERAYLEDMQLARQRRFSSFSTIFAPSSHLSLIRIPFLKSFITSLGNWGTPTRNNLWAKAVDVKGVQNILPQLMSFEFNNTFYYRNETHSRKRELQYSNLFDMENSITWLLQRNNLLKNQVYTQILQPNTGKFSRFPNSKSLARNKEFCVLNVTTPSLYISNHRMLTTKSLIGEQTKNSLNLFTQELSVEWSMWSEEISQDLYQLYLMTWLQPKQLTPKQNRKSTFRKITFRH